MIEESEIETELLGFVQREVFAPEAAVTAETDLIAAGFDSMSLVRILLFVELTYGLWIPEKEINAVTLRNLRALTGTVARLLHAA
jgi:acyl carrier protein